MEGKEKERESARASPLMSLSMSTGPGRQTMERKKEFDRRVLALTKDFQDLNLSSKPALTLEDFTEFFIKNKIANNERAEQMFYEFDDTNAGQVSKSQYIKKCLQIEDQVIAKINEKVSNTNVLKTRFDDALKKLSEAKALLFV